MVIGHFRDNAPAASYTGAIACLTFSHPQVIILPNLGKLIGKEPDFILSSHPCDAASGFEIGAAWKRQAKDGEDYLSVKLDGPGLRVPITARLTRSIPSDRDMVLHWIREAQPAA